MNNPRFPDYVWNPQPVLHPLDSIRSLRLSVGDGLNDDELTRLLRERGLPDEAGFSFLSYSEGFVMFLVPVQDLAALYQTRP